MTEVKEEKDTKVKNNPLYNSKRKIGFLEDQMKNEVISEDTSVSYARIFGITAELEARLNNDLSNFSFEELEDVFLLFKAKTINTVQSYGRIVSSYLNWCVRKGHIKKNYLADLKTKEFEKYILNREVYITDKQLRRYEEQCVNFQDAVILRLLFIGVSGRQMSEIRNLKASDIDFDSKLIKLTETLKTDKDGKTPIKFSTRHLEVDERTLKLLKGAIDQKTYEKRNGQMDFRENIRSFTDLVDNKYVVRASATRESKNNLPVDKFVIYRRIQTIAEFFGIEDLTAKFIQRSGMLYVANQLMTDNEFTLQDLKLVAKHFNVNSYHNLKGFLTLENIRCVYDAE